MFEKLFNLIAPHLCLQCQKEGKILCDVCAESLPAMPIRCYRCHRKSGSNRICRSCQPLTSLDSIHIVSPYESEARSLVRRLKYDRASAAAPIIAQLMSQRVQLDDMTAVIVTCAPTATKRIRVRGYDQAARIARQFAACSTFPYRSLLWRTGQTRQVGASKKERQRQISNAFVIRRPSLVKDAHIILIDDVLTTGATLEAAAYELQRAGARKITAIVFAAA